jgi:copper chaperone
MHQFKVTDMTCGGCAASIRNAVLRVPGVRSIQADPARKDVVVDASADVTQEAIVAAITEAGYTEITALAEPDATTAS